MQDLLPGDVTPVDGPKAWLETKGGAIAIADLLTGDYALLHQRVVTELIESSSQ